MTRIIAVILFFLSSSSLFAQGATSNVLVGGQFFYFSDENEQGGQELPGGTTTFSTFSIQYNRNDYFTGIGLFMVNDSVGKTQKNSASGLKLEFFIPAMPYYFEYAYGFSAEQKFTNRSAETRSGGFSSMGFGVRVDLAPWLFFDGSFKQRNWTFDKEDGMALPAKINKVERLPYLGIGTTIGL